jgi:hypothetical protein
LQVLVVVRKLPNSGREAPGSVRNFVCGEN